MLYQDCSSHLVSSKNMAARGRGLFSLYIYIHFYPCPAEWIKMPLPLLIFSQSGYLIQIFVINLHTWWQTVQIQISWLLQKPNRSGSKLFAKQGISGFSRTRVKTLLVRNHWTDFNIILQKCSFGDPLPRLFKPFGFVKKHGHQGAGLIFPIYL